MSVKKKIIDVLTKRTLASANARVKKLESKGVSEEVIDKLKNKVVNSIPGVYITKKGNFASNASLDETGLGTILGSIPKWKDFNESAIAIEDEVDKEQAQANAKALFDLEVKRLRTKAANDLWDVWYANHDKKERNGYINDKLSEDIRNDLADKMTDLGSLMGKHNASAQEIYDLYSEIKEELAKAGVSL